MAHKRPGQLTPSPQWWKHLRKFNKRIFWKRERQAHKLSTTKAQRSVNQATSPDTGFGGR